jgi:N-acetylglutamate synthase-like GNAT family acetyltransferase
VPRHSPAVPVAQNSVSSVKVELFLPPFTLHERMNSSSYRVRRATLDDLPRLNALWASMHFAVDDLGKRITEFQIAENDSELLGAVGLQIAQKQGRIHSEAFSDFGLSDALRPLLWERIQSVTNNHGLLRLWTQEHAPFWKQHCGLVKADGEALQKLPDVWKSQDSNWLTLKLRDDLDTITSVDKEFAMFMETEKQRSLRTMQHAKILKYIAAVVAFGVILLALGAAFFLLRKNPNLLHR